MGNAKSSLDDLVYLRAWTAAEVSQAQDILRKHKPTMAVDRATFDEVVARRNPEARKIFESLDADADGRVDVFEILLTLTLWCCASWEEKSGLLFRCFDMNQKGKLRFAEVAFMASTVVRVLDRFTVMPAQLRDMQALTATVSEAFGGAHKGELEEQSFAKWFDDADVAKDLRQFVEAELTKEAPEAVEALVRERMRMLDYSVREFTQEVTELRAGAEELRKKRPVEQRQQQAKWAELWQGLDKGLFQHLETATEALQSEMAELTASLTQQAEERGAAWLLEPQVREEHSRFIKEIGALERRAQAYLEEAKATLGQLLELVPDRAADRPDTPLVSLPAPTLPTEDAETMERRLRLLNQEMRRRKMRLPVGSSATGGGFSANEGSEHFADVTIAPTDMIASSGSTYDSGRQSEHQAVHAVTATQSGVGATFTGGSATASAAAATMTAGGSAAAKAGGAGGVAVEAAAVPAAPAEAAAQDAKPIVVVFAAYDPPASEETPMLTLRPGDELLALGQDGAGWWYGKKVTDGTEGWFPPSYVQLKDEVVRNQ